MPPQLGDGDDLVLHSDWLSLPGPLVYRKIFLLYNTKPQWGRKAVLLYSSVIDSSPGAHVLVLISVSLCYSIHKSPIPYPNYLTLDHCLRTCA